MKYECADEKKTKRTVSMYDDSGKKTKTKKIGNVTYNVTLLPFNLFVAITTH